MIRLAPLPSDRSLVRRPWRAAGHRVAHQEQPPVIVPQELAHVGAVERSGPEPPRDADLIALSSGCVPWAMAIAGSPVLWVATSAGRGRGENPR